MRVTRGCKTYAMFIVGLYTIWVIEFKATSRQSLWDLLQSYMMSSDLPAAGGSVAATGISHHKKNSDVVLRSPVIHLKPAVSDVNMVERKTTTITGGHGGNHEVSDNIGPLLQMGLSLKNHRKIMQRPSVIKDRPTRTQHNDLQPTIKHGDSNEPAFDKTDYVMGKVKTNPKNVSSTPEHRRSEFNSNPEKLSPTVTTKVSESESKEEEEAADYSDSEEEDSVQKTDNLSTSQEDNARAKVDNSMAHLPVKTGGQARTEMNHTNKTRTRIPTNTSSLQTIPSKGQQTPSWLTGLDRPYPYEKFYHSIRDAVAARGRFPWELVNRSAILATNDRYDIGTYINNYCVNGVSAYYINII